MGIAQELDQTVDAFRNDPAGLTKSQQLAPSTIKLLALERIKREMDAKTNDINMSMSQNPKTIAQRKESEVLEGVMGVLNNNQAKKQSNMNKVASQGVAGQNAPNMLKMAGGGIIGFADRGQVKGTTEQNKFNDLLRYSNISAAQWENLSQPAKDALTKNFEERPDDKSSPLYKDIYGTNKEQILDESAKGALKDREALLRDKFGAYIGGNTEELDNINKKREDLLGQSDLLETIKNQNKQIIPVEGLGKMIPRNQNSLSGIAAVQPETIIPKTIIPEEKINPVVPNVISAQPEAKTDVSGIGTVEYEAPDYNKLSLNDPVKKAILDQLKSDPQDSVDFQSRTPEEQALIDRLLQERMDMRRDITDPSKLNRDALKAGLLSGPSSTAGGAFRNMGRGILGAQQMQDKLKRSELDAVSKLSLAEADKQQKIKGDAFKASQDIKSKATTTGGSVLTNEQSTVQKDATNIFEANKVNQLAAVAKAKIASQEFISKQDNKVKVDIANMEKEINLDKNKIAKESNSIRKTEGQIKADTYIIKSVEDLIIKADKNIRTYYGKQIKEIDGPLGAGQGLDAAEKKAKKEALEKKMNAAIREKTLQLNNDAEKARKRLQSRDGMGTPTGGSGNKSANVNKALDIINNK